MALDFKKMQETLQGIYQEYESASGQFKEQAVCGRGCAFCCFEAGKIDIVTLEGMILLESLESIPEADSTAIFLGFERDRTLRSKGKKSVCPFLDEQGACRVYNVRPFSCRQLYSLRECEQGGPLVHKQAVFLARKVVKDIQKLDDTGYSGHHSFILKLLQNEKFKKTYTAGGFDPGRVKKYGKKHGIMINRFVK
ncbi:YkgJ family cysteine cluster protein [Thermodesulfobacteriota bacterium]